MPRHRQRIDDNVIAQDIMSVLEGYAKDAQFLPTQGGLYSHMRRMGYTHTIGQYNYWFLRLVQARRIDIDYENTRAIRPVSMVIIDRQQVKDFV